jgi:sensor histidine kinase YesM
MKAPKKSWFPQSLRYKLFLAFVVLILMPFGTLGIYNYQRFETLMQEKISQQSFEQLQRMIESLEDLMSIAFKTSILLEQDKTIEDILKYPDTRSVLANKYAMDEKFISINNSFFLHTPFVYYTIIDFHGNVYASYIPKQKLNYASLISEERFSEVLGGSNKYSWVTRELNYVSPDLSASPYLMSLYSVFKDRNHETYGVARISIDYSYWFQSMYRRSPIDQDYFIITSEGESVAQTSQDRRLSEHIVTEITKTGNSGYLIDRKTASIVNYSYIESLDWYMVNRIPNHVLFQELDALKKNFFLTFFTLVMVFVVLSYVIVSAITKPLLQLKNKMGEVVQKGLQIRLPEENYRGEMAQLANTFNTMIDDMKALINRLKAEERQKEVARFQMLLSQMDPHFLLNTLNTVKWIAIRLGNTEIENICVSLGKLLETSLNTEMDMIHLRDEIELVEAFVFIQKIRYKTKFDVFYEFDASIEYALVPKLSIQPLVENAIQHGIAHKPDQGLIRVSVARSPDERSPKLVVTVEDNGIGIEQSHKQKTSARKRQGIGLTNLRERLSLLFKDEGELTIDSSDRGTRVTVAIPFLLSTPYDHQRSHEVSAVS